MNRPGMTLIELTVAIAIAGLVLSAAYAAYGAVTDVNERTHREYRGLLEYAQVRSTMTAWLEAAESDSMTPAWRVLEGQHEYQSDDAIELTVARAEPFVDERSVISLRIDRDPETPESGLVATVAALRNRAATRIELARHAAELHVVQLVDQEDGRWYWVNAGSVAFQQRPRAIEVRLGGLNLPPLLQLPITAARLP